MSADIYSRIKKNPQFHELVRKRSSFAWTLSLFVLVLFYGFMLVVAFQPGLMATRLGGETSMITLGPVLIFSMFVLFWALTAVYVSRANGEFDAMTHALVEDAARGGRS